jgi:hypothetical protein
MHAGQQGTATDKEFEDLEEDEEETVFEVDL